MIEARRQRRFIEQSLLAPVAAAMETLEGHLPLQPRVPGDKDLAHAALAEARHDPVAPGVVVERHAPAGNVVARGVGERCPAAGPVIHRSHLVDEGVAIGEHQLDEAVAVGPHQLGTDALRPQPRPQP
jgi:hypothetical protein